MLHNAPKLQQIAAPEKKSWQSADAATKFLLNLCISFAQALQSPIHAFALPIWFAREVTADESRFPLSFAPGSSFAPCLRGSR
jgi:hypothetical protein